MSLPLPLKLRPHNDSTRHTSHVIRHTSHVTCHTTFLSNFALMTARRRSRTWRLTPPSSTPTMRGELPCLLSLPSPRHHFHAFRNAENTTYDTFEHATNVCVCVYVCVTYIVCSYRVQAKQWPQNPLDDFISLVQVQRDAAAT